jgi:hypothetical protein
VKKTIESSLLLRSSTSTSAPGRIATVTLLRGGVILTMRGGLLLVAADLQYCVPATGHSLVELSPAVKA